MQAVGKGSGNLPELGHSEAACEPASSGAALAVPSL